MFDCALVYNGNILDGNWVLMNSPLVGGNILSRNLANSGNENINSDIYLIIYPSMTPPSYSSNYDAVDSTPSYIDYPQGTNALLFSYFIPTTVIVTVVADSTSSDNDARCMLLQRC